MYWSENEMISPGESVDQMPSFVTVSVESPVVPLSVVSASLAGTGGGPDPLL